MAGVSVSLPCNGLPGVSVNLPGIGVTIGRKLLQVRQLALARMSYVQHCAKLPFWTGQRLAQILEIQALERDPSGSFVLMPGSSIM